MVFSIFNEKKKSNCGCPQANEADANGHFVMFFLKICFLMTSSHILGWKRLDTAQYFSLVSDVSFLPLLRSLS